jgi:hypothetical protein
MSRREGGAADTTSHGSLASGAAGVAGFSPGDYRLGFSDDWRPSRPCRELLAPLLSLLCRYDQLRGRLESEGGRVRDLGKLAETLDQTVGLQGSWRAEEVRLSDPGTLRFALNGLGLWDVHADVRRLDTGLPAYYLCRTVSDCWSEYGLVVEDLHVSPGYPMVDDRFVRLMRYGHEAWYIRLSPLREAAARALCSRGARDPHPASDHQVDALLYAAGRNVFSAAWHEDQRLALRVAMQFHLPTFLSAMELLYLVLSGEMCELRATLTDDLTRFFEHVYPQPAILALLRRLPVLDGGAMADLPQAALGLYSRLSAAFAGFLRTDVPWATAPAGQESGRVSLSKLVFANCGRLERVAPPLSDWPEVSDAAARLEAAAAQVVAALTASTAG